MAHPHDSEEVGITVRFIGNCYLTVSVMILPCLSAAVCWIHCDEYKNTE